jgi:hypothetical protein
MTLVNVNQSIKNLNKRRITLTVGIEPQLNVRNILHDISQETILFQTNICFEPSGKRKLN